MKKKATKAFGKSAEDQIMKAIMSGRDPSDALLAQADPARLANRFSFTVINEPDMGGVMAVVTPKGCDDEDSKKSGAVMQHLFPEAEYIDDCVLGLWQLPGIETERELGEKLKAAGMAWSNEPKTVTKAEISFTLHDDTEFGIIANFRPYDDDESLPARLPRGADYDECVVGGWTFPHLPDKAGKVAQDLVSRGFKWDSERQNEVDASLTAEISSALNPQKPANKGPKP